MANLMKLEEQLSPASRGYPTSCSQEGDEDTTSVASDRSDETFDMAKGNLSLLEKAIALESERAKVMRDRMASEHTFPRRDHHHHHHRGQGEHSPRLSEERKSRMHHDGLKRAYYPKGRQRKAHTLTLAVSLLIYVQQSCETVYVGSICSSWTLLENLPIRKSPGAEMHQHEVCRVISCTKLSFWP